MKVLTCLKSCTDLDRIVLEDLGPIRTPSALPCQQFKRLIAVPSANPQETCGHRNGGGEVLFGAAVQLAPEMGGPFPNAIDGLGGIRTVVAAPIYVSSGSHLDRIM